MVKKLLARQETWVRSLGPEDPHRPLPTPGGRNGTSRQYSGLEDPMDRGALGATIHGVTKSQ